MSHVVESWEDDESFALPSNDFNPIRISSASSYSSAGVLGGDEDEDDDQDWGVEDFGGRVGAGSFKLGVPSSSGATIGGWGSRNHDAERDGFDEMDDEDEEDDRTDTLKAGQTTIRLPPSSSSAFASNSNTPTLSTPNKMSGTVRRLANQSSISSFVIPPDVDIEDGFSLPTSLSNLNLRPLRSQSSRASFSSTTSASNSTTTANSTPGSSYTWGDAPSTSSSTTSGGAATGAGGGSFSRKSNGTSAHPRLSAPSPSSSRVGNILHIPFSPPSLVRSSSEAGDHPSESSSLDFAADASEDADDLDGIVLSDPLFFARTNDVRLQALLDAKGKGHNPPAPSAHHSSSNANSSRTGKKSGSGDNVRIVSAGGATDEDMSFEAGLVIDDDVPITMGRLGRVRAKARNKTLPLPKRDVGVKGRVVGGSGLGAGGTVPSGRASGKEDWEKDLERERGWGRTKSPNPPPVSVRETFRQPDDQHPFPSPSSSSRPTPSSSTRPRAPQSRSATAGSLSVSNTLNSSPPGSSLRVAKSSARINLGHGSASSSSLHPSSAAPPSPSPHQQAHYPGSHAASLLSRKASLPMLFAAEQERSSTPSSVAGSSSGGGAGAGRFAAPTAASLARQRDRVGGPDLFNPPNNSSTTSPPTSSRPSTPNSPFPLSPSMATVQPFHQRLTMPTSSSRQKTRLAITSHLFSTGSHPSVTTTAPTPSRRATTIPKPELASMPKKKRHYGDGTELDGFEDLKVDREKEGRYRVGNATTSSTPTKRDTKPLPSSSTSPPQANPSSRQGLLRSKLAQVTSSLTASTASTDLKRKKPTPAEKSSMTKSGPPRTIKLIRHMGHQPPTVKGHQMRYDPKTLRWEGNESALQAFEGLSSSARPLLIAHHTGKSTTSLSSFTTSTHNDLHSITTSSNSTPSNSNQSNLAHFHPGSPISASAAISLTAKVVGNMWFDPERMKWIHMGGSADEEEEDVFAGMDDEDEVELALALARGSSSGSVAEREEKRSSSRARRIRESGASSNSGMTAMDLDDFLASEGEEEEEGGAGGVERKRKEKEFARRCRLAEEGHRAEVAGWGLGVKVTRDREENRLWEIRRVAMRTGRGEREGSSRN